MNTAPFLEIVTRHHAGRPSLIKHNQASLASLTNPDWVQTLLVDDVGRGTPWANRQLASFKPKGQWVWILEDDDICTRPTIVDELKTIAADKAVQVVMARGDYSTHGVGVIPNRSWGRKPEFADVSMSCFFVRRDTYLRFADHFPARLAGDFAFISAVFDGLGDVGSAVKWHDVQVVKTMQQGQGRPE